MAEQDFDIKIRTTADTAGVKQTQAELGKLSQVGGALGLSAVGVGLALNKIIRDYGESQLKIAQELDKQLTTLTGLAEKWADIAKAADSAADVNKLGQAGVSAIQAAEAEFTKFQNSTTAWWKDLIDNVIKGPTFGGTIFEKLANEQSSRLAENVQRTRDAAIAATKLGESYKEAFEKRKTEPAAQAIDELNAKIRELEATQKAVGIENIESYVALGRQIEIYKGQLQEIIKLQEKAKDSVQKQVQQASPQARAVIMNEQAAAIARDQGREIDAAMFERTAGRLKTSATPGQQSEVAMLEKLIEQNGLLREIRDSWR